MRPRLCELKKIKVLQIITYVISVGLTRDKSIDPHIILRRQKLLPIELSLIETAHIHERLMLKSLITSGIRRTLCGSLSHTTHASCDTREGG